MFTLVQAVQFYYFDYTVNQPTITNTLIVDVIGDLYMYLNKWLLYLHSELMTHETYSRGKTP